MGPPETRSVSARSLNTSAAAGCSLVWRARFTHNAASQFLRQPRATTRAYPRRVAGWAQLLTSSSIKTPFRRRKKKNDETPRRAICRTKTNRSDINSAARQSGRPKRVTNPPITPRGNGCLNPSPELRLIPRRFPSIPPPTRS